MEPQSTTEAHRVFGDLYRKSRPPDLQKKVDDIVAATTDVFVRIRRIQELDEGHNKQQRAERGTPQNERRAAPRGGAQQQRKQPQRAPAKKKPGFLSKLFGGELATWGKATGTINTGLLGLNYSINPSVRKLFELEDENVVATVKSFRFAMTYAWEVWEPAQYNTIIAAYQFFNEFIKVNTSIMTAESADRVVGETFKLQKFYGTLLSFPGYKKTLTETFPELVRKNKSVSGLANTTKTMMNFITGLEGRTPGLKNSILAFYSLSRKKVETWDTVAAELKIGKPEIERYRAPESIMKKIIARTNSIKEKYVEKKRKIKDIAGLRQKYFHFDGAGKIKVDFLNPLIKATVEHIYPRAQLSEGLLKSHKTEPHRLLYTALRDFDIIAAPILSGSVSLEGGTGGHAEEAVIFKPMLFKRHVEEISAITREMEAFIKKNANCSYSFNEFIADLRVEPTDGMVRSIHSMIKSANKAFLSTAEDLRTVLENHSRAAEDEQKGHTNEGMERTKALPVESLEVGERFLPHANRSVMTNNRMNSRTVVEVLHDVTRNCYNYLYIFRDTKFASSLASTQKIQSEMNSLAEQLRELGIDPDTLN